MKPQCSSCGGDCGRPKGVCGYADAATKKDLYLLKALEYCQHQIETMRMWTGNGWHYFDPAAKRIHDKCCEILDAEK
jgi:hypothetical protein